MPDPNKNFLTMAEAANEMSARMAKYPHPRTGKPQALSKAAFHNSVVPLLLEDRRKDAYRIGNVILVDRKDWWMWLVYAEERARRISTGEWGQRHPWSIEDMEDIAMDTGSDGAIEDMEAAYKGINDDNDGKK